MTSPLPSACSCLGYGALPLVGAQSVHDACYNCLNWALPNNTDGSLCTKCAALASDTSDVWGNIPGSGVDNAYNCFTCTLGLGGLCTGIVS